MNTSAREAILGDGTGFWVQFVGPPGQLLGYSMKQDTDIDGLMLQDSSEVLSNLASHQCVVLVQADLSRVSLASAAGSGSQKHFFKNILNI